MQSKYECFEGTFDADFVFTFDVLAEPVYPPLYHFIPKIHIYRQSIGVLSTLNLTVNKCTCTLLFHY